MSTTSPTHPTQGPISVPVIHDLIQTKIGQLDDEQAIREFFDIVQKPGPAWFAKIKPGVDAAQRVLGPYITEQLAGDALAGQQPTGAEKQATKDQAEAVELVTSLFGTVANLRAIASSIKSNPGLRLEFVQQTNGTKDLSIVIFDPKAELEPEPPKLEPEGGFFEKAVPQPFVMDDAKLNVVANFLRPKVKVDPSADLQTVLEAVMAGEWSRKVVMLLPIHGQVNPHVAYHWCAQMRRQPWLGLEYQVDSLIQHARNLLVERFMKTEADWSQWLDADIIAPFGDPKFFYDPNRIGADPQFIPPTTAGVLTVQRLMKAGKSIVGGVYHSRSASGDSRMVIQPDLHPTGPEDKALVADLYRSGPQDRVVPVGYVATGCALIHRKVYLDIMEKFPERKAEGKPFDFFGHNVGTGSEDIAFCKLAAQAGHHSFLDLGLWCAHLGTQAFMPPRRINRQ